MVATPLLIASRTSSLLRFSLRRPTATPSKTMRFSRASTTSMFTVPSVYWLTFVLLP